MKNMKRSLSVVALMIAAGIITSSKAYAAEEYFTADAGDGISHIAKKAGLDYMNENTWNKIAQDNGYNNYNEYHLLVGDKVKIVRGEDNTAKPKVVESVNINTDVYSLIRDASNKYNIRVSLLKSLLTHESGLRTNVISPTGDYGIAQINLKSHPDISVNQAFDPEFSIAWAAANLRRKIDVMGSEFDALRAYNCGEGGANSNKSCGVAYANNILRDAK